MSTSCQQMQKAGYKSGSDKSAAANACMQKWNACYSTCNGGAKTYANGSNAGTFQSYASSCYAYKDRVDTLLQASNDSTSAATAGQNCDSNSSSSPSAGSGGDNSKDKDAQKDAQKSAECTANPSAAGCADQASPYAAAQKGTAEFGNGNAKGSADVTDTSALRGDPSSGFAGPDGAGAGSGAKNAVIPNNSGGGVPGGGGSPNSAGGGGLAGALSGIISKVTDIEKGLFSGNGGAAPIPATETPTEGAGGVASAPTDNPSTRGPASLNGADLRRYLPGHDLAPPTPPPVAASQYHPSSVNLFTRITARLHEKCASGELVDCP